MTNTRFTVTHPDGTQSTRSSKTMAYTHVIVAHTAHDQAVADVTRYLASAEAHAAEVRNPRPARTFGDGALATAIKNVEQIKARLAAIGPDGEYGAIAWSQSEANAAKTAASWARRITTATFTVVGVDA